MVKARAILKGLEIIRLANDLRSYPKTLMAIDKWILEQNFPDYLSNQSDSSLNTEAYSFEGKGVALQWGSPPWYTFIWVRHRKSGKSAKFALWHKDMNPIDAA